MPKRHHLQADFNDAEWEKVKKGMEGKTQYRFARECVMNECSRTETARKEPGRSESGQDSGKNLGTSEGNGKVQASDQDGDPFA